MKIKDEIVLQGMTQAASDDIEYNTIGVFQTINSNTPGYYIVRWTVNANVVHTYRHTNTKTVT